MITKTKATMLIKKLVLKKEELELVKEFLEECSKVYYNTGEKMITDTDYDYIYNKYLDLGGEEIVGAEPESEEKGVIDSEHKYQKLVGTTLKAQCPEDFDDWLDKVFKDLGLDDNSSLDLYITLKFDGNSVLIEYNADGTVNKALTRGKNGKGVDLTDTFRNQKLEFIDEIQDYTEGNPFGIKYEVLFRYSILKKLEEDFGESYKNPRSAVSGKLGSLESAKYSDYYTLEPLWMTVMNKEISREDELNIFETLYSGNDTLEYLYELGGTKEELKKDLREVYQLVMSYRQDLDFMIDGLVIDIPNKKFREKLGYIDGGENLKPRWCIALKFPYMEAESTIEKIEFTLGDSGKISPVAYFKPVTFNGCTHIKQYLQGYKRFMELGLGVGSRVIVEYHNDTLSYITKPLDMTDEEKNIKPIPFTDKCPVCGGPVVINDNKTFAYCGNDLCEGKAVGRINNFLVSMDIKGIRTNIIQKFYDANIWKSIEDLFVFKRDDALKVVEGIGETSLNKIIKAIDNKKYYDYEILGALGIPSFGNDGAKSLVNVYTLEDIMKMIDSESLNYFDEQVCKVEGISHILAENIFNGLTKNKELVYFLMERGYKMLADENNFDDVRYNFVVTGDLSRCTRDILKMKLEKRGHKMSSSVSNKTDYLVTNETTPTTKYKKAKELGKPIINEEELYSMLNLD